MAELIELLKGAQAAGAPVAIVAVYFLWKIDKSLTVMRASNEVLTETLLRLVPGFKIANDEAKKNAALKEATNP